MSFKRSVLIIAIVVLLALMILISILLGKSRSEDYYVDSCPDYWTTRSQVNYPIGGCSSTIYGCCPDRQTPKTDALGKNCPTNCYNIHNLGQTSPKCPSVPTEKDFSGSEYEGNAGLCKKRDWAKQCGITWDGITDVPLSC